MGEDKDALNQSSTSGRQGSFPLGQVLEGHSVGLALSVANFSTIQISKVFSDVCSHPEGSSLAKLK